MLGMAIRVVGPGAPTDTYHWETEQEDFLVLSGEALLIVEGRERPLKQWDFVHCPPETRHAFVGAGDGLCVLLCASSRQFQKDGPWGYYCADDTAARYNASSPEDTQDGELAYARFGRPGRPVIATACFPKRISLESGASRAAGRTGDTAYVTVARGRARRIRCPARGAPAGVARASPRRDHARAARSSVSAGEARASAT